jgi:hypothetical protein
MKRAMFLLVAIFFATGFFIPITATDVGAQTRNFADGPTPNQHGATYLMISHADFIPALAPLVQAHEQRGETVALLDVQSVYDAFSSSQPDPEAIRSLLKVAVQGWSPVPRQVLLVGAGTVNNPFIPAYLIEHEGSDPIACDTCYVRLRTLDPLDQLIPDLPIGRLPVRTLAQAEAVVAKTVTHLLNPPTGVWQTQALFLTDNDYEADGTPDPAGSFTAVAELGIAALPTGMQAQRFYYAPDRPSTGPYDSQVSRLRCRLFRAIDGGSKNDNHCPLLVHRDQSGAALLTYVGHGSAWQWGFTQAGDTASYLWYLYDADGRTNGQKLPILISLTCMSGAFANPHLMTTDERLVLWPHGGVVAALSPSGQGVNTGHAELLAGLMPRLFGTGDRSLGAAHLAGMSQLRTGYRDLAFSYNILGDPAVQLPVVPRQSLYLPITQQGGTS